MNNVTTTSQINKFFQDIIINPKNVMSNEEIIKQAKLININLSIDQIFDKNDFHGIDHFYETVNGQVNVYRIENTHIQCDDKINAIELNFRAIKEVPLAVVFEKCTFHQSLTYNEMYFLLASKSILILKDNNILCDIIMEIDYHNFESMFITIFNSNDISDNKLTFQFVNTTDDFESRMVSLFDNNNIQTLWIRTDNQNLSASFFIKNKSIFRNLLASTSINEKFGFYIGPNCEFSSDMNLSEAQINKETLTHLKKFSEERHDIFQSLVLKKLIMECDYKLLSSDRTNSNFQDKIIFKWSRFISNYGTNWIKSICVLILINLVATILTHFIICLGNIKTECSDFFYIWSNFHNPTLSLEKLVNDVISINYQEDSIQPKLKSLHLLPLNALNIIHKVYFSAILYDLIKTLRRFGKQ